MSKINLSLDQYVKHLEGKKETDGGPETRKDSKLRANL
jgi:hypothetical protein